MKRIDELGERDREIIEHLRRARELVGSRVVSSQNISLNTACWQAYALAVMHIMGEPPTGSEVPAPPKPPKRRSVLQLMKGW